MCTLTCFGNTLSCCVHAHPLQKRTVLLCVHWWLQKHDKRTGVLLRQPCLTNVLQQVSIGLEALNSLELGFALDLG